VYQGQKVHFPSESEFSSRGAAEADKRGQATFWQTCTLNFLGARTNYKPKTSLQKLQISNR
jgi:hypothetical protein